MSIKVADSLMPLQSPSKGPSSESRVLPVLALAAFLALLSWLPVRYRLLPAGIPVAIGIALAAAMIAAGAAPASVRLARFERNAVAIVVPLTVCIELISLAVLLRDIVRGHQGVPGVTLLTTAVAIWSANVIAFALAYWQLDRAGPMGRAGDWQGRADFTFPKGDPVDGVPADWRPTFVDYLFLSFNTSSAFSPTDASPLTQRAKLLMLLQSTISLVTLATVAARAINVLGS